MKRMANSNVFLSGLGGLGIEIGMKYGDYSIKICCMFVHSQLKT